MVLKFSWQSRRVEVHRHITAHRGDSPDPSLKGKDTGAKRARRRHRDKCLHSNAVMHLEWNGKPSEIAAEMGNDRCLKYELRADANKIPIFPFVNHASPNPRHRGAVLGPADSEVLSDGEIEKRIAARRKMSYYERQRHDRDIATLSADLNRVTTVASTKRRNPVSLWINRACREITLRVYKLAFALPGDNSREATRVYFDFKNDVLSIPRHVQLWRSFTKIDLSKLTSLTMPEVFADSSGNVNAVGREIDILYTTDLAGKSMLHKHGYFLPGKDSSQSRGKWLSAMSGTERTKWQLKDSLEMLNVLLPSLKLLTFASPDICNLAKKSTTAKCHVLHPAVGCGPLGSIIFDTPTQDPNDGWSNLHALPSAVHYEGPDGSSLDRRCLQLHQETRYRHAATMEGRMEWVSFPTTNGGAVTMLCHVHDKVPMLEQWEQQLRIPSWGRTFTQIQALSKNLKWILEMSGTGHRRCETLDYVL